MPKRVAVLANRAAGRGRAAHRLDAVLDALSGVDVERLHPSGRDTAVAACRDAVAGGVDALVAMGGDGTVHLAVQATAGTGTPLGIVPLGTGNDFAHATGVPADPVAAARAIAADVLAGTHRAFDAVRAGDAGWFCCILSAGFDSDVNARANRMRWPRGRRRYDLAIFRELISLAPRTFTVEVDGVEVTGPGILVAVGNAPSYGGGLRMCPDADPADGLLDVTVVGPLTRRTVVRLKPMLADGSHTARPEVRTLRGRTIRLAATGDAVTFADGEAFGELPVTLTAEPGALRMVGTAE